MDSDGPSNTGWTGSGEHGDSAASLERPGDIYRYQVDASEPLSDALIAAIDRCVEATDGPPLSDRPLLYEVVDLDALDGLFTGRSAPTGDVVFQYDEFRVRVTDSREIVVRRRGDATDRERA